MVDQVKGQTHNVEFTACASVAAEWLHPKDQSLFILCVAVHCVQIKKKRKTCTPFGTMCSFQVYNLAVA